MQKHSREIRLQFSSADHHQLNPSLLLAQTPSLSSTPEYVNMPDTSTYSNNNNNNDDPLFRTHKSRRLLTSLRFKTYSDAKLAGLFLENYFPITLFKKVFDVIVDPEFDSDDVTFEDIWDMFEYVSARRRKDGMKREGNVNAAVAPLEYDVNDEESKQAAIVPGRIPRDILDLVVDQLVDDRLPLGIAAMDPQTTNALISNSPDLRNMSLVHRSWTSSAQRGLRRRAIIPIQHITDFLLSPLCGPWITEMIIYWSFNNGDVGATKGDIWALESLLERTPNVRSLVFNTSLVWNDNGLPPPSWRIDMCLEIITDLLPNLENLWLKHLRPLTTTTTNPNEQRFDTCGELRSLYHYLPKLSSLKYLSIRWWSSDDYSDLQLNWDEHPPPSLKTIDLYLSGSGDIHKDDLTWLLKPRNSFSLDSLSLYLERNSLDVPSFSTSSSSSLQAAMRDCLPGLKRNLKLVIHQSPILNYRVTDPAGTNGSVPGQFYSRLLESASDLEKLELFFFQSNLRDIHGLFNLPSSLETLAIHLTSDDHDHPPTSTSTSTSTSPSSKPDLQAWFSSIGIEKFILDHLPSLPHLQKILITRSPSLDQNTLVDWDLDALIPHDYQPYRMDEIANTMVQRGCEGGQDVISESLRTTLEERDIEFVFFDNAYPRGWDIPRGERHTYSYSYSHSHSHAHVMTDRTSSSGP
ncbi:uncharacterized protein FOMMEDRAFT_166810 [Fomitiporia mediterranea MF3/22]|uniref:uncharacterized protein n=1 Tax=Fomitiporia mediterranea (strain MF3/22) TaxID=694068 RepID=UPI00044083DA|nr:uncharacterized protein FOMMEDRAFT_166810 [Fomitiporia mediterranea MF3/22]EJD05175.1 hypothetical protein FOMMEDRAFT_166810 [Fomitiporia mediterranea MF3/22]